MCRDVREPQRPRLLDQQAEQAPSFRPVMDPADLAGLEADRDELGEPLVLAYDAERAVPGVHQVHGRLDDPPQHRLEL